MDFSTTFYLLPLDRTVMVVYDNNGNIVRQRKFAFSLKDDTTIEELESTDRVYQYQGDRLMLVDDGYTFMYNAWGNPTYYRGKSLIWENGTRLTSYDGNTFTYDGMGRRLTKNDVTFTYDSQNRLLSQSNGLNFFYDTTGVAGFAYNGDTYFYRKDAQSNITAILDFGGRVVVRYEYDAWGNHVVTDANGVEITDATNLGMVNPFRYRGYYYDTETGLYYLKSRYYDPDIGRFFALDDIEYIDPEIIGGLNLYAYCGNNPVMNVDPNGNFGIGLFLIGLAVSSLLTWRVSEIVGSQVVGGASSVINGGTAVYTGMGLLSFGPIGWMAGIALILIGAGTMAFGVNEIAAGATGTNYIQEWTGMSDGVYTGLYMGLNIASSIGTMAGNIYMNYANVNIMGNRIGTTKGGKPFQRYTLIDDQGIKQYR